jgi:hypothetical protein
MVLIGAAAGQLGAAPGAAGIGTRADDLPCHEVPLCYVASHAESDPNRLVLYDLDLVDSTRGISRIKADRAEGSGRDFGTSGWVLTGHVQVFMPEGQLQADRATVQFAGRRSGAVRARPGEWPDRSWTRAGDPLQHGAQRAAVRRGQLVHRRLQ